METTSLYDSTYIGEIRLARYGAEFELCESERVKLGRQREREREGASQLVPVSSQGNEGATVCWKRLNKKRET